MYMYIQEITYFNLNFAASDSVFNFEGLTLSEMDSTRKTVLETCSRRAYSVRIAYMQIFSPNTPPPARCGLDLEKYISSLRSKLISLQNGHIHIFRRGVTGWLLG